MLKNWKIYFVVVVTLVVVQLSYIYNLNTQRKHFVSQATKKLEQISNITYRHQMDVVNKWVDDLNEIADSGAFYRYLQALKNDQLSSDLTIKTRLENLLLDYSQKRERTQFVKFVGVDGTDKVLIKNDEISQSYMSHTKEEFYKKALNLHVQETLIYKKVNNNFIISFVKPIFINNMKVGTLISAYDFSVVTDVFDKLIIENLVDNIFILNENDKLLYSNQPSTLLLNIFKFTKTVPITLARDGLHIYEKNIIFSKRDPLTKGKLCVVTYNSTIKNYMDAIAGKNMSSFVITGLLILLLFLWMVQIITQMFGKSFKKIANSENYLKTILYMMNNLLFIVDAETMKVMEINQSVFITLGYNEADLVGKPISEIFADDEETLKKVKAFMQSKIVNKVEVVFKSKSNDQIPVLFSSSIIEEKCEKRGHIIRKLVCVAIDISKQKKIERELDFLAHHDSLTKLSNRMDFDNLIQKEISRCVRSNNKFALFYIDLDGFKAVNDKYGHNVGDLLLVEAANRLEQTLRKEDTIFRIGGDEFAAIITNIGNVKNISQVAENIITELSKTFVLLENSVNISSSIGIAIFPEDANDSHAIIRKADYAMYQAKKAGKNCYKFCSG